MMKKRQPCAWSQSRSPLGNSPRPTCEGFPSKARSVQELKRRRAQRGRSSRHRPRRQQQQKTNGERGRDAFGSLESLFDPTRALTIPELDVRVETDLPTSRTGSRSPRGSANPLQTFRLQAISPRKLTEPNIIERIYDADDFWGNKSKDIFESNLKLREVESLDLYEILSSSSKMADQQQENDMPEPEVENDAAGKKNAEQETLDLSETEGVKNNESKDEPEVDTQKDSVVEKKDDEVKDGSDASQADEKTLCVAPITDSIVINEMQMADQRCQAIAQEIEQLRYELAELANKKDLTQEEKLSMQDKHEDLMVKVAEFEEITQKIQQLLGLQDPIGCSFAKMFEMMPCPGDMRLEEEEDLDEENWLKMKERSKGIADEYRFDFTQPSYPEDNLPRVIVCGPTEDDIPKIVVADSERRGKKKCLDDLTSRLNESLTLQEILAKENAQLEGGKYRLAEALLEKDSAVEILERKVCGLQAEMRLVVKENNELTRQLACLNQRLVGSSCAYTCPGGSPSTTVLTATPTTYEEGHCRCDCCGLQVADRSPTSASPRLAGGASKGGIHSSAGSPRERTVEMCCRAPAVNAVKFTPRNAQCLVPDGEARFAAYGNTTKQLEQQLGSMENEVRNMQMELANVQRERQQLEQQRKLLKCTGPCAPCSCCPAPTPYLAQPTIFGPGPQAPPMPTTPSSPLAKVSQQGPQMCTGPCTNAPMGASTCPQQQLRDLREQYARLQEDYKNKLVEVSCLRSDSEKLKQESRDAREEKEKMEIKLIDAQERLKLLEAEKSSFAGNKEQLVEQEQALHVAKQRFREAQDEIEELRSLVQDQALQLEDYRNKYLQAQEIVEEQRRQLDLMEMDNARMNENVTLEIGRVKNQFQEKLAELAPLPDILKQTQVKLQEAQQLRLVAERNGEDLTRELMACKEKMQTLQSQLDVLHNERMAYQDGKGDGAGIEELELKLRELRHENERMKNTLARFEEHEAQLQKRIDEKNHEIAQLSAMLEQVREDSARQVARTKERCETVRKTMQGQIAEMERQLAQCRATARAAQKDRDEIRQKMQGQINNLNEAFDQAQGRIRSLQGHVNYLKTSYTNIFKGQGEVPPGTLPGESGTGYDSCDCNY